MRIADFITENDRTLFHAIPPNQLQDENGYQSAIRIQQSAIGLSPMLHLGPALLQVPLQAATEKYRSSLVSKSVGILLSGSHCDRLKLLACFILILTNHYHNFTVVISWSPQEVVLVSTDGLRQPVLWSKEINGPGLAVVVTEDRSLCLLLWRQ